MKERKEVLEEEVSSSATQGVAFSFSPLAPFANPPIRVGLADRFSFPAILSFLISTRAAPSIRWYAVIAGVAIAVIVSVIAREFLAPVPGGAATILGIGIGGYVAGKWADSAGLYHGAIVGAAWVALEALISIVNTEPTRTQTMIASSPLLEKSCRKSSASGDGSGIALERYSRPRKIRAKGSQQSPDMHNMIDYLIAAAVNHLGENMSRPVSYTFSETDSVSTGTRPLSDE